MKQSKLMIVGGGTGGHVFPGIAIAQEWQKQNGDVVFVGTPIGQENELVPRYGFRLLLLKVGRLKGSGVFRKFKTLFGLPVAFFRAFCILSKEKPNFVLGIGGYASGPLCITAKICGYSTGIIEQNAQPGFTNRVLGKFVKYVYLSFAKGKEFFPHKKTLLVGNPVRGQITVSDYSEPQNTFRIFVFGGSQGAVNLNKNFINALQHLKDIWTKIQIVHQASQIDIKEIQEFYQNSHINANVQTFFHDIEQQYDKANLIICRAGAGTLTELAQSGRPAIIVPYPYAADDHQKKNAQVFVDQEAAWMVEEKNLTPEIFAEKIRFLYENPQHLMIKAENIKKLALKEADKKIVHHILNHLR